MQELGWLFSCMFFRGEGPPEISFPPLPREQLFPGEEHTKFVFLTLQDFFFINFSEKLFKFFGLKAKKTEKKVFVPPPIGFRIGFRIRG